MKPDLYRKYYRINHCKNKHSSFCRRSSHDNWFRGQFTGQSVLNCKT